VAIGIQRAAGRSIPRWLRTHRARYFGDQVDASRRPIDIAWADFRRFRVVVGDVIVTPAFLHRRLRWYE
jgi:hypothetical protein